ncbi:tripartite tricarboxylate transporter substrate binding protein [Roseomonas sp. NAR14]|uniref:Tripartite tricarboxylate transporter substrate binding protein n=1 Tax=Roseomonas acroporae TaxID=2937791 RepID=A0A9X1YA37_9PROT|nr:tripartite tricarboxylate transporter substrate binding protein [Roseomonas acroporae]MCK8785875.1 tripartite tricarboxylate transporter substrate binding protein [Roseomonas acroporae]
MIARRPLLAALPALLLPAGRPRAQEAGAAGHSPWPSRPVRIVVPYPPGGSTDVLARTVAQRLQEGLGSVPGGAPGGVPGGSPGGSPAGVSVIVDNRPGGASVVGTQAVATAAPDGYTLCLSTNQTHAANAAMVRDLPYRPVEDFAPIGRIATVHHALVVPANGPATLAELVARGRAGRLTYASSGAGSASHVIAESLVKREGLQATHIPYRGGAQATTDTVSGVVDFFVSTWPQVAGLVREGRLRCLGLGAPARLPELPAVPTFAEAGAPYMAVDAWFGLWAPARTPAAIVDRLGAALGDALREPETVSRLAAAGFLAAPLPPAEFGAFQRAEVERWRALVRLTGITIEG